MKKKVYVKKAVEQNSPKKLPFFYRIISDLFPKTRSRLQAVSHYSVGNKTRFTKNISRLFILYLLLFVAFLSYIALDLYKQHQNLKQARMQEISRFHYWEKIVVAHVNYTDAYYQAALAATRLNEKVKAVKYLDHALILDPNFKDAEKLRQELTRKY